MIRTYLASPVSCYFTFLYHLINFSYILDGVPRMRERPIGDLVVGLKQLGAGVDCVHGTNCPPVRVIGKGGLPGGKVRLIVFLDVIFFFDGCIRCV